jgi:hypothetical protein
MTYAHYATMGGFCVEIEQFHNALTQGTLTTNGLLFLADQRYFFELSTETIADKSKANLLAKSLVCLQVLWVAGQTIERKVAGYPISILEIHTLVHVFCALIMYTLWFQKPYGVNEPTIIGSGIAEDVLAFIVASSQRLGQSGFADSTTNQLYGNYFKSLYSRLFDPWLFDQPRYPVFQYYGALDTSPQIRHHSLRYPLSPLSRHNEISILRNMDDPRLINHLVTIEEHAEITSKIEPEMTYYAGEEVQTQYYPCNVVHSEIYLSSGQALRSGLGPRCVLPDPKVVQQPTGFNIGLSKKDIYRLDMAGAFINKILSSADQSEDCRRLLLEEEVYSTAVPFDPFKITYINRHGTPLICLREENLSSSGFLFRLLDVYDWLRWDVSLLLLAMILIPTAYGGIHLSALHEMFPTTIERGLWKASCFTLIGYSGYTFLSLILLGTYVTLSDFIGEKFNSGSTGWRLWMRSAVSEYMLDLISWGFLSLILAATILCFAARIFVVVESFISLRHVPVGVYQTPPTNFMGYIPHL